MLIRMLRWAVCAIVAGAILNAAPAFADSVTTPLSQTSFGDLIVDNSTNQVFISSPADNSIAVYDFNGNLVQTISDVPDASGMLTVGSTLYVAEPSAGTIEEINPTTFADEGPLVQGLNYPEWLAYAGGKLWVNDNDGGGDGFEDLYSVTLSGEATPIYLNDGGAYMDMFYNPEFATSPATPNTLYVSDNWQSPALVYEYDVSGDAPVQTAVTPFASVASMGDMVVSPDGSRLVPAAYSASSGLAELSTSNLSSDGTSYPVTGADGVATSSADGGLLAIGADGAVNAGDDDPEIEVFPFGDPNPIFTAAPSSAGGVPNLMAHGLAMAADGTRLFAVSDDGQNEFGLWTYDLDPDATSTAVSPSTDTTVEGDQVTLTATVGPTDDNGTVGFYADGSPIDDCSAQALTGGWVGTATCTTTALPGGVDTVSATYSGDSGHATSTGSATVTVELAPGSDYTWAKSGSSGIDWSSGANWNLGVAPYGTVGTLTFPNLGSSLCTPDCAASNDLSGLSVGGLVIDSDPPYDIDGNQFSLGSGGLTVTSPDGAGAAPTIQQAVSLTASQTWSIDAGPTLLDGSITGSDALTTEFDNGSIEPTGGIQVGDIVASGSGGFYLDGNTSIDGSSLGTTTVASGSGIEADQDENSVGPLIAGSGGWVSVGGVDNGGGQLSVDGALTFAAGSELDLAVDAPGTAAGFDYSQVQATGPIDLAGADLEIAQGVDSSGYCDDLNPGDVLTLLSSPDGVSGTFSDYGQGASVDIEDDCDEGPVDASGTLSYSPDAVTLTITGAGDSGDYDMDPLELSPAWISGSAEAGQTLTINPGSWQDETSFDYSWWACGSTTCTQIPNASGATLQLTKADVGYQIGAMLVANGPGGSSSDQTDLTEAVVAEPLPTASANPSISGSVQVGDLLTATNGTWSNSPTGYAYQWERCSSGGTNCAAIPSATSQSYTLTSADEGSTINVQVVASNFGGNSTPASSSPTALVTTAPVSSAAVEASLDGVLKPAGRGAAVGSIISHRGYTFTFHAPSAGKLEVTWAATVRHKTATLARGTVTAVAAVSLKLDVRLTADGARDLKRYSTLRVKSVTAFTASGLNQIVKSSTFTLSKTKSGHLRASTKPALNANSRPARGLTLRLIKTLFGAHHRVPSARTQIPRSAFGRAH